MGHEGESKIVRRLTPVLLAQKFKPTVYSFTENRCGEAAGTDEVRARFSAKVFRRSGGLKGSRPALEHAVVALVEDPSGPLTIQRAVQTSNLEVRVKRFHIGPPVHRYLFTDRHPTVFGKPLGRWTRFAEPVVCFGWRHPMLDTNGKRLADEPVPDDYAALWVDDVAAAKRTARAAFAFLEGLFGSAHLVLVDICFFIDRSGRTVFGEVNPDCLRVRDMGIDPGDATSFDKDVWRKGGSPAELKQRYTDLHDRLFPPVNLKPKKDMKAILTAVRNKRLKMSPGGLITLPVAARKSLGLTPKNAGRISVTVSDGTVLLSSVKPEPGPGLKISPRGNMNLSEPARAVLARGVGRHYWVSLDDTARLVRLHPFES